MFVSVSQIKMAASLVKTGPVSLFDVENVLNWWLNPKFFAETWDNVGLLVGSSKSTSSYEKTIKKILLCNDLTCNVMNEAIEREADLIIAYHPPIFKPIKSFNMFNWKVCQVNRNTFMNTDSTKSILVLIILVDLLGCDSASLALVIIVIIFFRYSGGHFDAGNGQRHRDLLATYCLGQCFWRNQ